MRDDDTIGGRHTPLREQVLRELRRRIISGEYPPGDRLREDRLAGDFGVSRNPVREALRVVEAEGFVRVEPRRGAVVIHPDADSVADLFVIRALIEPMSARLAATRATDAEIAGLRALHEESKIAGEAADYRELSDLNSRFHLRIAEVSGNPWLRTFATSIFNHVQWVFRQDVGRRAPHSWSEHNRLLEAICARDPEAAEAAAAGHVSAARSAATHHPQP